MARPKRPFNGQETIQTTNPAWMGAFLGVRQRQRFDSSQHLTYRQANGVFDPLTYLLVLDTVANIHPDIELRSANLTAWLNLNRNQFLWDPVTVGKVLSDICDQFEDVLGEKNGILERGKDYRGTFYLIHRTEASRDLFISVHETLVNEVHLEIAARASHVPSNRLISPLSEIPALRGEFVEA